MKKIYLHVTMRDITKIKGGKIKFKVGDDPQDLIALFLTTVLTDMDYLPQEIAQLLQPEGEGYYLNGRICAYRIESSQDLPADFAHLISPDLPPDEIPDIWVIFHEIKKPPYPTIALYGHELFLLYEKAKTLLHL